MSHMNDGFVSGWERDRRTSACDYDEKHMLAVNGEFFCFHIDTTLHRLLMK